MFKKPLKMILYDPDKWNEKTLMDTVDRLNEMIKKKLIDQFDELFDMYIILFNLIDIETNKFKGDCKIGEDLKLRVIHCTKTIVKALTEDMIEEIIQKPNLYPILGHSIHVLLNIGLQEKFKELQITAVEMLNFLIGKFNFVQSNEDQPAPGDVFAAFLPGTSIAIMKIIISDDKIPQKLTIGCLKALSSILKLTLPKSGSSNPPDHQDNRPAFIVNRDKDWLNNSCTKIQIVLEKIIKTLIVHKSLPIKRQLITFSQEMIEIFSQLKTDQDMLSTLLEVPLVLVSGEEEEMTNLAQSVLKDFSENILTSSPALRDTLFDKLYQLLTYITRELQSITEEQKIAKIQLLEGYFICLGPQGLNSFLVSQSCQNRLLQSLISCSSINSKYLVKRDKLIELLDKETIESMKSSNKYPAKKFVHFEDVKCEIHLKRCCSLLGRYADGNELVDYFTNILGEGTKDPAIILVANFIVEGMSDSNLLESLLTEYIGQLTVLTERSGGDDDNDDSLIAICLLMEGLSIFAEKFGPPKQHAVLLHSLHLILANTGSDKSYISDTALITLQRLVLAFNYASVKQLLSANIDYVLNYLNIKLKHFETDRKYCSVIHAILNLTEADILPYFEFTMNNILASLDIYYSLKCDILVDILRIVITFLSNSKPESLVPDRSQPWEDEEARKKRFREELREYLKSRRVCETLEIDDDEGKILDSDEPNEDLEEPEQEEKKELPIDIRITIQILERCSHLLSNPDADIQVKTMEIIMTGLKILESHEDELLPLAHKLWTPILKRFRTDNVVMLKKCFHCLLAMIHSCGDFLRSRTVEQVIPRIISFLRSQWKHSHLKTDSSPYKFTVEYQLQHEIISQIGRICCDLKIEGLQLWPIIECIIPYLTNKQPKSLQEAAITSSRHLMYIDSFAVYSYLEEFLEKKDPSEKKYFESNVRNLLKTPL